MIPATPNQIRISKDFKDVCSQNESEMSLEAFVFVIRESLLIGDAVSFMISFLGLDSVKEIAS